MRDQSREDLLMRVQELEERLEEADQFVEAIKNGEVDAFAINTNNQSEIYTLQSGDYAYRVLIEQFSEGAINVSDDGLIIYTNNYFCELIKLPYDKVIGSYIFDFIDAQSRNTFDRIFTAALKGKDKGEIDLSVNKKKIPVYISLTSLQPNLPATGIIITDLTEKKKNEQTILKYQHELEKNNELLQQSNGELASFAYVASHDLQEPLRKINTFSALILSADGPSFSEKSKNLFDRILSASSRMRTLIDGLLNYSRMNNGGIIFIATDLNVLLKEVVEELSELLDQENANIESGELPVLNIIPHQVMQLFSNLISNAVKFKRNEVPPVIRIEAEPIPENHKNNPAPGSKKSFYRIGVTDNGIGFEKEYEEKVFELFQRLHGRAEYEGTGIGLAICKKIVQNHGGLIIANSTPGVGTEFSIYFPQ